MKKKTPNQYPPQKPTSKYDKQYSGDILYHDLL
ncbi:hypothetical protein BACCAC_01002 [Bacteroides caccae ATCC 43185]|nr:hypothetical protein BACCAC_01002 [Bacteroides caccae ATCC 43185]